MEYNDIFSVSRQEYISFVEQIKPEYRKIETIDNKDSIITNLISKKTNKCLCSRLSYNKESNKPEEYFIFEMPDNDERQAPIPKYQLKLNTREEVQAFFNAISTLRKEHKND